MGTPNIQAPDYQTTKNQKAHYGNFSKKFIEYPAYSIKITQTCDACIETFLRVITLYIKQTNAIMLSKTQTPGCNARYTMTH